LALNEDAVDTVIGFEAPLFPELVNHLDNEAIERPVEVDTVLLCTVGWKLSALALDQELDLLVGNP
jgi:hypothetical protein